MNKESSKLKKENQKLETMQNKLEAEVIIWHWYPAYSYMYINDLWYMRLKVYHIFTIYLHNNNMYYNPWWPRMILTV